RGGRVRGPDPALGARDVLRKLLGAVSELPADAGRHPALPGKGGPLLGALPRPEHHPPVDLRAAGHVQGRRMNPVRDWFQGHTSGLVLDLEPGDHRQTDAHYTLQWGREKAFFDFLSKQPAAKAIMPAGQMGWPALFEEIRTEAKSRKT